MLLLTNFQLDTYKMVLQQTLKALIEKSITFNTLTSLNNYIIDHANLISSHDVTSGGNIKPCITCKIDKPIVKENFGNVVK